MFKVFQQALKYSHQLVFVALHLSSVKADSTTRITPIVHKINVTDAVPVPIYLSTNSTSGKSKPKRTIATPKRNKFIANNESPSLIVYD